METFSVELTKQQTKDIQKEWAEHGMNGGLMFAQIATSFGPFQAQKGMLQVTIISAGQREKIQAILKI